MDTNTIVIKAKPVIKWVGGKRQIMSQIIQYFPKEILNYYELFVGGGSVFLELLQNNDFKIKKKVYINDIMTPLMKMYSTIQNNTTELIKELSSEKYANNLDSFTEIKKEFNILKKQETPDYIKMSAIFIYLNRVGFNGMYRENGSGEYNIPFGKQINPQIYNEIGINTLSDILKTLQISNVSYDKIKISRGKNNFVYLDPPYHSTFTGYNKSSFGEDEQIKLKNFVDNLKCKVAISNSNTDFIRDLYKDYNLHEIQTKRLINSKKENRRNIITELLITNY
jgi:DNA adenine methylase